MLVTHHLFSAFFTTVQTKGSSNTFGKFGVFKMTVGILYKNIYSVSQHYTILILEYYYILFKKKPIPERKKWAVQLMGLQLMKHNRIYQMKIENGLTV